MNRTIKFRGKEVITGTWVYGFYVHYITKEEGSVHSIIDEIGRWVRIDPETLGQFIRINNNGRELYEGDILHGHSDYMMLYYKDGAFVAKSLTKHWKISYLNSFVNYKLAGNRFDNEELLNP